MSFVTINNRNNFLVSKVPEFHPDSLNYLNYWKIQKKRCIEGFWGKDDEDLSYNLDEELSDNIKNSKGKWRFMPGNLYFYVNFGTIMHQDEKGPKTAPKKKMRPYLRDLEWEFLYNWLLCRGFSGFADDDVYSCNLFLEKYYKGNYALEDLDSECFDSKGKLKQFVAPKDYIRQLHEKPLGVPLYNNPAKNLFVLGSRGFGKSYIVGVAIILHEILFDGAKIYNEQSIKNPYKVEVFVGAAIAAKSADILDKTFQAMINLPGAFGEGTKAYRPSPFFKQMAGSLSPNNMKNPWRHEYTKKEGGTWIIKGTGSNLKHGVYTSENPEAAAGTRPGVMVVEEVGLMSNVLTVHGSNTACMVEGSWKFGSAVYIGTGGNVDKIQESEVIFRDPEGFDFLVFEDEWEGSGKIGWFVPAYYSLNQFKDSNGNTNVEKAKGYREEIRLLKRKSKDPSALSLEMMNYPLVPSEMFLNAKGAYFPQALLKSHLAEMTAKPHLFKNSNYYVELEFDSDGILQVKHVDNTFLEKDFPIKDNKDRPGIIAISEMPKLDSENKAIKGRYIQGTDTYDDDESVTNSLGATYIMDIFTGRIVAEYVGRRETTEFYEITRKLNLFYSAEHNYENNKKGLYGHYKQKNSLHLLCDTPEILRDVEDITISKVGNKRKGTTASKAINSYGRKLILSWLLETAYGESDLSEKLNTHTIKFEGLVRELMHYNGVGNYDRISALGMLFILREEKLKNIDESLKNKSNEIEEDPFFKRTYKDTFKESKFLI